MAYSTSCHHDIFPRKIFLSTTLLLLLLISARSFHITTPTTSAAATAFLHGGTFSFAHPAVIRRNLPSPTFVNVPSSFSSLQMATEEDSSNNDDEEEEKEEEEVESNDDPTFVNVPSPISSLRMTTEEDSSKNDDEEEENTMEEVESEDMSVSTSSAGSDAIEGYRSGLSICRTSPTEHDVSYDFFLKKILSVRGILFVTFWIRVGTPLKCIMHFYPR
uniref:Uncharacterized protein n=1 Tax=Ditylum brightwellii TaxID=49249 RepID=A0A7S4QZ78_9STRA|mmetsp:Transcript_9833/g.13142  ORF Transcript_9833/g.13142 Transcript_9833/m.13142 type:complete len:218 (+) Transcript_9833:111-764(+)